VGWLAEKFVEIKKSSAGFPRTNVLVILDDVVAELKEQERNA
jgi:hypothetical protein